MKIKKLIISAVASILLVTALTGCTGTTDNKSSAKLHTIQAATNAIIASGVIRAHSYAQVHIR